MPVGRGLRKVTEPWGLCYYLALIVDGTQMERNWHGRVPTWTKMFTAVTIEILEIP